MGQSNDVQMLTVLRPRLGRQIGQLSRKTLLLSETLVEEIASCNPIPSFVCDGT